MVFDENSVSLANTFPTAKQDPAEPPEAIRIIMDQILCLHSETSVIFSSMFWDCLHLPPGKVWQMSKDEVVEERENEKDVMQSQR